MAVQTDKNNSKNVSATYTKVAPAPVYDNIAAFIAAQPTTKAKLQLTDALVYGNKNNKNIFLHDGTAMIQLYDSKGNLPASITYGKKVSATFSGTYLLYNGQDEMQNATLIGEAGALIADREVVRAEFPRLVGFRRVLDKPFVDIFRTA